jgi:hypothetical protein
VSGDNTVYTISCEKRDGLIEIFTMTHRTKNYTLSLAPGVASRISPAREWWIGWVEEAPVNAQERLREELLASLRAILAEALEFNRKEARAAAERG